MRSTGRRFVCALLMVVGASAGVWAAERPGETRPFGFRVRIVRDGRPTEATSVLVRRETREPDVVFHFVTAAHLFKSATGQPLAYPQSLTVFVDGAALAVRSEDVKLPVGSLFDLAVFKVTAPPTAIASPTLTLTVPEPGQDFFIAGFTASGTPSQAVQRVRRVATLAVYGDRRVTLAGCAGAPAVADGRVFGMVTACETDMPPIILPFAPIAEWVGRHVPGGLSLPPAALTQFQITERSISGPLLTVACGEEQTADVDVPFWLHPGELVVDAKADLVHRSSLRLGEVAVLRLADRSVKLRFTLAGHELPRFRPQLPCQPGQALITVRLDVIARRAR